MHAFWAYLLACTTSSYDVRSLGSLQGATELEVTTAQEDKSSLMQLKLHLTIYRQHWEIFMDLDISCDREKMHA